MPIWQQVHQSWINGFLLMLQIFCAKLSTFYDEKDLELYKVN